MAYTINKSFLDLKTNLNITGLQTDVVSTRQKNVRNAVEKELSVVRSFLTGSYYRNTMIAPLKQADIDIFMILNDSYYHHYNGQNGGQGGLLDLLKRALRKTYTETPDISRNGQAVTIQFTDFAVDVVPAFDNVGGGYVIPNSSAQNWITTNPLTHVELVTAANKEHNGDFIPLVKMIKRWNRYGNSFFNSFHLEVVALKIFTNVNITDYPSGMRYFFEKGRDLIDKVNYDPAGYGGDIGAYLNTADKIASAVSRFQTAYDRAFKAESYESNGKTEQAVEEWRKIFGDYFPSYG